MEILGSRLFDIGTLVWVLALAVFFVRVFTRLGNRGGGTGTPRAGVSPSMPSAGPVEPRGADPGQESDPGIAVDEEDVELDSDLGTRVTLGDPGLDQHVDTVGTSLSDEPGSRASRGQQWDRHGFDQYGVHRQTGRSYDPEGYDKYGYDGEGYDRKGYDFQGYNRRGRRRRR